LRRATTNRSAGLILLSLLLAFWLACLSAGSARAATVQVEEELGDTNHTVLEFTAVPGELNALTVTLAGEEGDSYRLQLTDTGAAISVGAKCTGGGQLGEPATCTIHRPAYSVTCPRTCFPYSYSIPGTEWDALVDVHLGDGGDSLDASSLSDHPGSGLHVDIEGGSGNDAIATGNAADTVEAGPGDDIVHSGDGEDRAISEPVPDGSDTYDLGGGHDEMSYGKRTEPLDVADGHVRSQDEDDVLTSVEDLVGGLGADHFSLSGDHFRWVSGGGGDDLMDGSPDRDEMLGGEGDDELRGNTGDDLLIGGDGSDLLIGGTGNDSLIEQAQIGDDAFSTGSGSAGGTDTGDGGAGNDIMALGRGADKADGGNGDDSIYGGSGGDRLAGGPGDDQIAGEAGADAMWGDAGRDTILAGQVEESRYPLNHAVDSWSDRLDCGAGRDRAVLNQWDHGRHCERQELVRLVRFVKRERFPDGTVNLAIDVQGGGRLAIVGRGVDKETRDVDPIELTGDHSALVTVRARGGALRALRRHGHVTLRVGVRFRPKGGVARTQWTRVQLVKRV
jgi:Ca2+-binding RTX toxin-like protein